MWKEASVSSSSAQTSIVDKGGVLTGASFHINTPPLSTIDIRADKPPTGATFHINTPPLLLMFKQTAQMSIVDKGGVLMAEEAPVVVRLLEYQ